MRLTSGKYIIKIRNKDICLSKQRTSGLLPDKLHLFGSVAESKTFFSDSNIFDIVVSNESIQIKSKNSLLRYATVVNSVKASITNEYNESTGLVFSPDEIKKHRPTTKELGYREDVYENDTFYVEEQGEYFRLYSLLTPRDQRGPHVPPRGGDPPVPPVKRYICILDDTVTEKSQLSFDLNGLGWIDHPRQCNRAVEFEFIPVLPTETFIDISGVTLLQPIMLLVLLIILYFLVFN
jgi:hypothetical protein